MDDTTPTPDPLPPYPGTFPAPGPAPDYIYPPPPSPPQQPPPPLAPSGQGPTPEPSPRRSWLGFGVAAGAVALAAGAFFVGHATSGGSPSTASAAPIDAVNTAASSPSSSGTASGTAACDAPTHKGAKGTLKSVTGSTLIITTGGNQDVTVNTSASTKVTKIQDGKVGDVTNGATVFVHGTAGANNSLAAEQIVITPAETAPKGPGGGHAPSTERTGLAVGTVSGVNNGSFTVTEPDGTRVSVTTSSSTKVVTQVNATLKDLVPGKPIAAAGTTNPDGSVTATSVVQNTSTQTAGKGFGFSGRSHGAHGGAEQNEGSEPPSAPAPPKAPAGGGTA